MSMYTLIFIMISAPGKAAGRKAEPLIPFLARFIILIKKRIDILGICWLPSLIPNTRVPTSVKQNVVMDYAVSIRVTMSEGTPPNDLVKVVLASEHFIH